MSLSPREPRFPALTTRFVLAAALVALATVAPVAIAAGTSTPAGCAKGLAGGDWPTYGKDLSNSRHQDRSSKLTVAHAADLAPKWVFSTIGQEDGGTFPNTPVAADGCLFLASDAGYVYSINASTGALVWKVRLGDNVAASPAVHDGRVFIPVNLVDAPYVVALDERTGEVLWRTELDRQVGSGAESSAVPFAGMLFVGVDGFKAESGTTLCPDSVPACEKDPNRRLRYRGAYLFLDQKSGRIITKRFTIPEQDFKAGYSGGSIWSTPAIDPGSKHAYIGTGNPFSANEHQNTNAILKIDLDRRRKTFGAIVGSYHGTTENVVDGVRFKPTCAVYVDVFTCETTDFDFGASPQLFTDSTGRKLVGDVQKSGVYHAVERANMKPAWKTVIGGPPVIFIGSSGTATIDGGSIFVSGSAPGTMSSLDGTSGSQRWLRPIADGVHVAPTSSANGVIYQTDSKGFLHAWDRDGAVLMMHSMAGDVGSTPNRQQSANGITIAYNTVYVPTLGYLIAYQ